MTDLYADLDARIQHFRASDAQRDDLLAVSKIGGDKLLLMPY